VDVNGRSLIVVARWVVLALGVSLTTYCFVRLVEVRNEAVFAAPWWWLGLIGITLTLLGLGAPWARRRADDASP
jgi:hypothetical protein